MSQKNDVGFPVLVVASFHRSVEQEYETKLVKRGFRPEFTTPSRLPDPYSCGRKYGAILLMTDRTTEIQRGRAKALASKTGLPFLPVTRQISASEERFQQVLPHPSYTEMSILEHLVQGVEVEGLPWGWVLAHKEAGRVSFPDHLDSTEDFLNYVLRLPPEKLPETLRHRTPPALPPPSNKEPVTALEEKEAPVQPEPEEPVVVDRYGQLQEEYGQLQEEYGLLKEEYDRVVNDLREKSDEIARLRGEVQQVRVLESRVADLEKHLQSAVPADTLKKMAAEWRQEGEKSALVTMGPMVASLEEQIRTLQSDLESSDTLNAKLMEEVESWKEKASFASLTLTDKDKEALEHLFREGVFPKILRKVLESGKLPPRGKGLHPFFSSVVPCPG